MATPAEFDTAINAALTAIDANDWESAVRNCMKAELIMASIPNMARESTSMQWRDTIANIRREARRRQVSGAGIQTQQIEIENTRGVGEGDC